MQAAAKHAQHQLAGSQVAREMKSRESEQALASRGILHTGNSFFMWPERCCVFAMSLLRPGCSSQRWQHDARVALFCLRVGQAPSLQGVAAHLEHQLAGAQVAHHLKGRESEHDLAARGVVYAGTPVLRLATTGSAARASPGLRSCNLPSALCCLRCVAAEHSKQAPALQSTARNLQRQLVADTVSHRLSARASVDELRARGIIRCGASWLCVLVMRPVFRPDRLFHPLTGLVIVLACLADSKPMQGEELNTAKARYTIALVATSQLFKSGDIDADEKVCVCGWVPNSS